MIQNLASSTGFFLIMLLQTDVDKLVNNFANCEKKHSPFKNHL